MTEQEWVIVTTALTDLFDIVKQVAPEKINIDKMWAAGRILVQEHNRIRARQWFTFPASESMRSTGTSGGILSGTSNWQKKNEELEKKKEAQRAQELGDLTETLKLSIEKAEKDRQGE